MNDLHDIRIKEHVFHAIMLFLDHSEFNEDLEDLISVFQMPNLTHRLHKDPAELIEKLRLINYLRREHPITEKRKIKRRMRKSTISELHLVLYGET